MTKLIRAFFALSFGLIAFPVAALVAFEVIGIPSGPDYGPMVAIAAGLISIGVAYLVYPRTAAIPPLFGLGDDLGQTVSGRAFIVAFAIFVVASIIAIANEEDYILLVFVPASLVIFALIIRWVVYGSHKTND